MHNDPVNFVDPSGYWGFKIGGNFGADVITGKTYSGGLAVTHSKRHGLQMGLYSTEKNKIGTRLGLTANFELALNNAHNLEQLDGRSNLSGGGDYHMIVGAEANIEVSRLNEIHTVIEGSLSVGVGASVGASVGDSKTDVMSFGEIFDTVLYMMFGD